MLPQLKSCDIVHRPLAGIAQQCRHRHPPPHRMITVQLLADVHNLGKLGTIQSVTPGRMRSILYPQGKAAYILKGVAPRLPPLVHRNGMIILDGEDMAKFESFQMRIEATPPIVFHKRVYFSRHHPDSNPSGDNLPIYGSVTVADVTLRLQQSHNLSLTVPDAVVSFDESRYQDKIKHTGPSTLFVHLRSGVTTSLKVLVEPEMDSERRAH